MPTAQFTMRMGGSPGFQGIPSNMRVLPPNYKDFYLPGQQLPQDVSRYSQVTSPLSTFFRQLERSMTPWGPLVHDAPAAGFAGGTLGQLGRMAPRVGPIIGAGEAAYAASGKEGQWFPQPEESMWSRGLGAAGNTLSWMNMLGIGGGGADIAGNVVGGIQGLMKAPDFLKSTFGGMGATMAGRTVRGLADRTGILRNGGFSPFSGGMSDVLRDRPGTMGGGETPPPTNLQAIFGGIPSMPSPTSNPFYNPDIGSAPSWAGGPSTWNQPASTWGGRSMEDQAP